MAVCGYCGVQRPRDERGWHNCGYAQRSRKRLAKALIALDEVKYGPRERLDTDEERTRLNEMAQNARAAGRPVREGY